MTKRAVVQCRVGQVPHDFSTFNAENCGAEDRVTLRVHDSLHETTNFVDFKSAGDRRHRQRCDANVAALRASFRLGQANAAQLRIDKNSVRSQQYACRARESGVPPCPEPITTASNCSGVVISSPQTWASHSKIPGLDFVYVAPDPGLPRLIGTDERVLRFVEVFGGVFVFG